MSNFLGEDQYAHNNLELRNKSTINRIQKSKDIDARLESIEQFINVMWNRLLKLSGGFRFLYFG